MKKHKNRLVSRLWFCALRLFNDALIVRSSMKESREHALPNIKRRKNRFI